MAQSDTVLDRARFTHKAMSKLTQQVAKLTQDTSVPIPAQSKQPIFVIRWNGLIIGKCMIINNIIYIII